MVNSFIRYSPYSTSNYLKKRVKAVTSMFIKVHQDHHKHYHKKVSYYYFFLAFKKIDKQHGGDDYFF